MTKLTKSQEQRFNKLQRAFRIRYSCFFLNLVRIGQPIEFFKQHLADELAKQKKEILEELEKMKEELNLEMRRNGWDVIIDRAIKIIKKI